MEITDTIIKFDCVDSNGRVFSKKDNINAINDFKNRVENGSVDVLGETDRDYEFSYMPDTNIHNVTHRVKSIIIDDEHVKATIELLNTPKGKMIQELLMNGECKLKPSIYGTCTIMNDNINNNNYVLIKDIISIDLVINDE